MVQPKTAASSSTDEREKLDEELLKSQDQMTILLESLSDAENPENKNINNSMSMMTGMLKGFSNTQKEMQTDMKDILESFKNGLLTHEKLAEMIGGEQIRSNFLGKLVGSVKIQLENLFKFVDSKIDSSDSSNVEVDQIMNDMNMAMKSVDAITDLIVTPIRRLDRTLSKIDNSLLVHKDHADKVRRRVISDQLGDSPPKQIIPKVVHDEGTSYTEKAKGPAKPTTAPGSVQEDMPEDFGALTDGRDPRSIFMNGGEIQISVKQTSTKGTQTVKEKPLPVGKPAAGGSPSKPIIDHPGSDSMKKPEQ